MFTLLVSIVVGLIAYRIGWNRAHHTVGKELELLGKFYVGKKVYSGKLEYSPTETNQCTLTPTTPPKRR